MSIDKHLAGQHDQKKHGQHASSSVFSMSDELTKDEKIFDAAQVLQARVPIDTYLVPQSTADESDGVITSAVLTHVAGQLPGGTPESLSGLQKFAESLDAQPRQDATYIALVQYASGLVHELDASGLLPTNADNVASFQKTLETDIRELADSSDNKLDRYLEDDGQEDVLHTVLKGMGVLAYSDENNPVYVRYSSVSKLGAKQTLAAVAVEDAQKQLDIGDLVSQFYRVKMNSNGMENIQP